MNERDKVNAKEAQRISANAHYAVWEVLGIQQKTTDNVVSWTILIKERHGWNDQETKMNNAMWCKTLFMIKILLQFNQMNNYVLVAYY